ATLPAILLDLPGYGAVIKEHDAVIKACLSAADCIVYVTRAVKVLSADDLDLLEDVFTDYAFTKKPIIWVLTGIDQADTVTEDRLGYEIVKEANDRYLQEIFAQRGGSLGETFVGRGFIPVSPIEEAEAELEDDAELAADMREESNMEELRSFLTRLIES